MLHEQLKGKSARERGTLKGREIAKLGSLPRTTRAGYDIEIVSTNAINGGVEILARAWTKDGQQIGFGHDGTVDIERFVIIIPPILVSDPNGDIPFTNSKGQTEWHREDSQEAILQALERILAGMKSRHDASRILLGKRGNTTTTVFPATDARFGMENQTTWAAARDATSAGFFQQPASTNETSIDVNNQGDGDPFWVRRYGVTFDTSSIPDTDVISSATFSLYINSKTNTDDDGDDYLSITEFSPANEATYVAGDFDQFGSNEYVTGVDFGSITTGQYTNLAANASGIAAINKTGNTVVFFREGHDILNNAPASSTQNALNIKTAAESGTASDPMLVIEHTIGATTVTPSAVSATFSALAPAVAGGANNAPSALEATLSLPTPTISGGALFQPAALAVTISVPPPTVVIADTTAFPDPAALTASVPAPTVVTGAVVQPGTPAGTFSVPAPSVTAIRVVTIIPSPLSLAFSVPTPSRMGPLWTYKGKATTAWQNKDKADTEWAYRDKSPK